MITNTTTSRSKHRIFISHNRADNELARYLATELRRTLEDYNAVWLDFEGDRRHDDSRHDNHQRHGQQQHQHDIALLTLAAPILRVGSHF